jgi:hypothetical protein
MDEENSNPETGELSDDDAVAAIAKARGAEQPEEEEAEAEAPADAPEGEPEAEEEAEAEPDDLFFVVKIDGKEVKVNRDELLNGYQRDADYRTKTQKLADERREVAAEKAKAADITARLIQEHQRLLGNDEPEPDWVKLAETDPIGWVTQRAQWEAKQSRREQARRASDDLVNQQRDEIARTESSRLKEKVTEWQDPKIFARDFSALTEAAGTHYGFAPEEVSNVLDHRVLLVLKDAAAFRKMQSAKAVVEKKVAEAPKPVVKPGSVARRGELSAKDVEAARNRLRATGSDDDAVRWLQMKRGR